MAKTLHTAPGRHADTRSLSFYAIFTVGFVAFALLAIFASLLGWQWRSVLPGAEGVKSMTGGVKAAVYTFMSHLL
jgi:light-harvesting complex 1 beta chain